MAKRPVRRPHRRSRPSHRTSFSARSSRALFNEKRLKEFATTVERLRLPRRRRIVSRHKVDEWPPPSPSSTLVYRRGASLVPTRKTTGHLFFLVLTVACPLVRPGNSTPAPSTLPATRSLPWSPSPLITSAVRFRFISVLFHRCGVVGLALRFRHRQSEQNLLALAWLLHYRKMVSLRTPALG